MSMSKNTAAMTSKYNLCGERNPELEHYCTLPKDHGGEYHIATIGPAEWAGVELSRWLKGGVDAKEDTEEYKLDYSKSKPNRYKKEE